MDQWLIYNTDNHTNSVNDQELCLADRNKNTFKVIWTKFADKQFFLRMHDIAKIHSSRTVINPPNLTFQLNNTIYNDLKK